MKCQAFRCHELATETRDIVERDGSILPWHLCPAHAAGFDLELADIEAHNAATEAQWDREHEARAKLYGTR